VSFGPVLVVAAIAAIAIAILLDESSYLQVQLEPELEDVDTSTT
jgi:hypothetical protein